MYIISSNNANSSGVTTEASMEMVSVLSNKDLKSRLAAAKNNLVCSEVNSPNKDGAIAELLLFAESVQLLQQLLAVAGKLHGSQI